MAEWLCRRVGETGHVIATDLQPLFLEAISAPNLEIWRHDIRRDPLPERAFDLVHVRSVLAWLPRPADMVTKMAAALKTGGWLLLEELDHVSARPDPSMGPAATVLSIKGWNALRSHVQSCGYDLECARHLYHYLSKNGLRDLQAEGTVTIQVGGTPSARFWKISLDQVRDHMLTAGLLTLSELEDYRSLLDSPEYCWFSPIYMVVRGRCIATQ